MRSVGSRWADLAAVVLLTGWGIWEFRSATLGHLPLTPVWGLAVGSFFLGYAAASGTGRRRARWVVAALAAVSIADIVIGFAVLNASELRVAAVSALTLGTCVAGAVVRARWVSAASTVLVLAVEVVVLWILLDAVILLAGVGLYDLRVYLGTGAVFADGGNPYLTVPLAALPADPAESGFLYPPILLPVFAALSAAPWPVVAWGWVLALVAGALAAFRVLGMEWRWSLILLAFPPLLKGITSGNVANLILLCFCLGPVISSALPIGAIFKVHAGIPALWLVRERRWRDLMIGIFALAGLALITLPFVGISAWSDWLVGLQMRAASQTSLPILYGLSLAQWLPPVLFVVVSVVAIMAALVLPGRRGLAGLGLASIVASPSLWPHGFLVAIPALLLLPTPLLWLGIGIGIGGTWLWVLPALGAWGLLRPTRASITKDAVHPMSGRPGPWDTEERPVAGT